MHLFSQRHLAEAQNIKMVEELALANGTVLWNTQAEHRLDISQLSKGRLKTITKKELRVRSNKKKDNGGLADEVCCTVGAKVIVVVNINTKNTCC